MPGFTYTLTLQEPVLANSLGGEPNSANSLFYIPGGLIRGAAINAYEGTKKTEDKDFSDFRRLFLTGETRFLNAYPMSRNRRALPTPLKYKKPKYFSGGDFSFIKDKKIHAFEETWQINVHTQRDAEAGHAKEDAGAVYRYIALPVGLVLQGAVLAKTQKDSDAIEKLLNEKTILLGKARTAGYGTVNIKTEPLILNESGDIAPSGNVEKFTITLLSPAIMRDEYGQSTTNIKPALDALLGVAVTIGNKEQDEKFPGNFIQKGIYLKTEIVGGFNRTWGLPLPQVTAIAAGSFFEVNATVDVETLRELEENGIGERRAEGFGRLAVNLSQDLSLNLSLPDEVKDEQWHPIEAHREGLATSKNDLAENNIVAKRMLERLARKDLEEKIIHVAREMTTDYPKGKIPNSQLSRWRVAARNALGKNDVQDLLTFLAKCKGKSGWNKMEKVRIKVSGEGNPRLTTWIEDLLKDTSKLDSVTSTIQERKLGKNSFSMTDTINLEYRLRLLDAVLAVMAKMNGGSNG